MELHGTLRSWLKNYKNWLFRHGGSWEQAERGHPHWSTKDSQALEEDSHNCWGSVQVGDRSLRPFVARASESSFTLFLSEVVHACCLKFEQENLLLRESLFWLWGFVGQNLFTLASSALNNHFNSMILMIIFDSLNPLLIITFHAKRCIELLMFQVWFCFHISFSFFVLMKNKLLILHQFVFKLWINIRVENQNIAQVEWLLCILFALKTSTWQHEKQSFWWYDSDGVVWWQLRSRNAQILPRFLRRRRRLDSRLRRSPFALSTALSTYRSYLHLLIKWDHFKFVRPSQKLFERFFNVGTYF